MKLGLVVMASGFSRRFGSNKLLHEIDGAPMIERVLDAIPDGYHAVVVTRFPEVMRIARRRGLEAIENALPHKSDTIRLGVERLRDYPGICFMVADQPRIKPDTLKRLRLAFSRDASSIVRAGNGGIPGNPVIFPASLYAELSSLAPDESGSAVIRRHENLVRIVQADMAELSDVDSLVDISPGSPN
ncbi:MAG: nucleotidyltransferase family protein [Clostridia bacterium]|nr:nucleotidyltransferase family protein [Clostridia bacterium]